MHPFWDIRLQKSRELENWDWGLSRSLEMSPCDRAHVTCYWRSIVTMALSRVVSEIFNVEKCRDLEIWIKGQVTESGIIRYIVYDFLLVFFSNFVLNTHRFWDIWLQRCSDLNNRGLGVRQGQSKCHRSIERMTSYWRSIVTMALSRVVSEIFNVEKCRDLEIRVRGHSRSLKVVPFGRSCMVSY